MPTQQIDKLPVKIESATSADAEIICDIRDRAWIAAYPNAELGITAKDITLNAQGRNGEFIPRRIAYLKEQLANNNGTDLAMLVAKVRGKVVGYIDPRIDEHKRRWISALYVAPEVQGRGVGGALMRHVLRIYGRSEDIFLEVISYNKQAIGFYKRFGFEKTNTVIPGETGRPAYMKPLPQVEMVLKAQKNNSR